MIALSTKLISVVLICNLKRERQSKTRSLVPVYRCSLTKLFFFESLWHQMLNLILSILVCEFLLSSLQFETCRGFHVCLVVVDWQPLNSHGFRILNFCLKNKQQFSFRCVTIQCLWLRVMLRKLLYLSHCSLY